MSEVAETETETIVPIIQPDIPKVETVLEVKKLSNFHSPDILPSSISGRYGYAGETEITFASVEQHRLYLLGKTIASMPKYVGPQTDWDTLYKKARLDGKLLVVRAYFNTTDISVDNTKLRSTSVIGPNYDSVAHPNGYVYELEPDVILALFAVDSQTSFRPYEDSLKTELRTGESLYFRDWATPVEIDELTHFTKPREQRSVTDAVVQFPKDAQPVAAFSKFGNMSSEWRKESQRLGVKFIQSKPNLDFTASKELEKGIAQMAELTKKPTTEIKQDALATYQQITELIKGKSGKITIPKEPVQEKVIN